MTIDLTPQTPTASTVPEPFGKPSGPGLWHVKGMMLPAYIQHVAHDLLDSGRAKNVSQAIQMAVGIIKDWAAGRTPNGKGHVHPDVQAAAARALAQWEAKRARAHAQSASHQHTRSGGVKINLARGVRQASESELLAMPIDQLTEHFELSSIALGNSHEYVKRVDTVLAQKEGPSRQRIAAHLKDIHRVTVPTDLRLSQLHDHHASDHTSGDQRLFPHTHTLDLEPRRRRHAAANLSHPVGLPLRYNAWGEAIELAGVAPMTQSVASSSDGARATYQSISMGKVRKHKHGDGVKQVSQMTAAELRQHIRSCHGMTPKSQDKGSLTRIHATMHRQTMSLQALPGPNTDVFSNQSTGIELAKSMKPGGGGRFAKLVQRLVAQGKSPDEARRIAAFIGRKKYGSGKFQKMAKAGRKGYSGTDRHPLV